jgi:hypothetical protein
LLPTKGNEEGKVMNRIDFDHCNEAASTAGTASTGVNAAFEAPRRDRPRLFAPPLSPC